MYSNTIILNYVIETDMCIDDTISSNCVMDDMPVRIKLSIDSIINVYSELAALIIKTIGRISDIQIAIQTKTPYANILYKCSAHNSIQINTSCSIVQRIIGKMNDNVINVICNEIDYVFKAVCRQVEDARIAIETEGVNAVSTAKFGTDFSIEVITDTSLKTMKTAKIGETTISIVTGKVDSIAGYYRTVDDMSQYTINDVGSFTLRELYFAEMR